MVYFDHILLTYILWPLEYKKDDEASPGTSLAGRGQFNILITL